MIYIYYFMIISLVSLTYANKENCDYKGILIYEDLGCKPVMQKGSICPIKYDCNLKAKNNTCTFRGRSIPIDGILSEKDTYAACIVGCACIKTNEFICAVLDCAEFFGSPINESCYRKYELGKCCSVGENCPNKCSPPNECKVDRINILEGQKYFPKNTCLQCVCGKGYTGKNESPFCQRQMCAAQVRYSKEIQKYCAPLYRENNEKALCCPYSWVCPSNNDKVLLPNSKELKDSDPKCRYGDKTFKLGERVQTEYIWYDNSKKQAICECIIPPLLTCKDQPTSTIIMTKKDED